jgi:hypothetical protein
LSSSAFTLREFSRRLSPAIAVALLEAASELNGYTAKDGSAAVRATIESGLGPPEDWPV